MYCFIIISLPFILKWSKTRRCAVVKSYGITPSINTNPNLMKQIYIYGMWHYFFERILALGLPRWLSGKEPACQWRRCGFHPWVGKIPWRRKWQRIPRILAWEIPQKEGPGGLQSMEWPRVGHDWATEHARTHTQTHTHTHTHTQGVGFRAWLVTSRRFRLPSSGDDRYCFKKDCFPSNGLRLENTPGT